MTKSTKTAPVPAAVLAANTSAEAASREAAVKEAAAAFAAAWSAQAKDDETRERNKLARVVKLAEAFPCFISGTYFNDVVKAVVEPIIRDGIEIRRGREYLYSDRGATNVRSHVSAIRRCIIALTNPKGLRPTDDETFSEFLERLRQSERNPNNGGNTSRGADRKGGRKGTGKAKGADKASAGASMEAAFALIWGGDKSLAAAQAVVMGDPDARQSLERYIVKLAALVASEDDAA